VYSNKLWWPPYNIFDNNNACESYGHWNEMLESTYVKRLQDIRLGAAQPLMVSEWRNKLKGHKETRELKSMREQRAMYFFERTFLA
jgi:hypothetical protein